MGGARNAAARMRTSARSAAGLVSLLQAARDRTDTRLNQWVSSLVARNPSVQDVINEVIGQLTTSGGSLEEESCKDSMAQAMAELMENQPNVDLLSMSDGDIWSLVELFLAQEACNRLQLDIGQIFESSRLNPREVVARMNEMRDYLKAEISAQMRTMRQGNPNPSPGQLESTMQQALHSTFAVYEGTL
ncbi:Qat anti-phage system associated protein QatB [Burkholderia pseudomallei]|uniref:Qat anti-phage system associated protein QatB n=1 Tax=Burkholderia pseudomallei TaxID=28450 RepID=UPI003132BC7A